MKKTITTSGTRPNGQPFTHSVTWIGGRVASQSVTLAARGNVGEIRIPIRKGITTAEAWSQATRKKKLALA